jgi:D-alanyl-D-alanine carboxypeptidase
MYRMSGWPPAAIMIGMRLRPRTFARAAVVLSAAAAVAAVPLAALAGGGSQPVPAASPASVTATDATLPALNPALLHDAIGGLPSEAVTGALVRVSGSAGRWSGTAGVADVRRGTPVRADGRFRIGSITKVFTAVVVLQLAAEHRVDLDRPVRDYLPWFPEGWAAVTVGQLLDHTDGMPATHTELPADDPAWYAAHRFDSYSPEESMTTATGLPLAFEPGTAQAYNGTGYTVAGMLIERVSGHSYAAEVRRRILTPLGLRGTLVPARTDPRLPDPHAHGYVTVDGTLVDVTEQSPYPWAEGGMISTSADLTRMLTALFRGRLLPPAQLANMFTVPDVPYAGGGGNCALGGGPARACFSMGLTRTALPNGVTVWGKSGARPGYSNAAFATRDTSRVLVYSLNATGNKDGSDGPYIRHLVAATFDPDLY